MEVLLNYNTGLRLLGFGALFVKDVGDNWVVHVQKVSHVNRLVLSKPSGLIVGFGESFSVRLVAGFS